MENADIKKYYKRIIIACCVNIVACIVIISMLVNAAYADLALGKPLYAQGPAYFVGVGIAVFYIVLSVIGIIFAMLSQTTFSGKIMVRKGFAIATFIIFISGMFIMLAAAILVAIGLEDVMYCIAFDPAPWPANCRTDLGYYGVGIVLMIVMVIIAILGIVSSMKVFTSLNKNVPRTAIPTTGVSRPQQVASPAQGKGKFCSACGTPNEANAKFCKNCATPF